MLLTEQVRGFESMQGCMHGAAGEAGGRTEARKHGKDGHEDRSACGAQQAAGQGRRSSHAAPLLQRVAFTAGALRREAV